jgi:hypothetical protein
VLFPILLNILAFITGIHAVGCASRWQFNLQDLIRGEKLAMVYLWVIGSTAFSLVHTIALLTKAPFLSGELSSPLWLFLHSLIGLFFSSAHILIDAAFEDKRLAERIFGVSP